MVFVVSSYDLGGNAGDVIEGVFSTREKAEAWSIENASEWIGQSEWWGVRETWEGVFTIEEHSLDNPD